MQSLSAGVILTIIISQDNTGVTLTITISQDNTLTGDVYCIQVFVKKTNKQTNKNKNTPVFDKH